LFIGVRAKPPTRSGSARPRASRKEAAAAATVTRYPHVSTGPLERDARVYEVRLEKVPGGLRLGEWRSGVLERHAPVLPASALRALADEAIERGIARWEQLAETIAALDAETAISEGRAGDLREQLRVERLDEPGLVRVARWLFWPGGGVGWDLQESPVMLPEARFREVLAKAAEAGLI
jgi:hypothetical protein